MAIKNIIESSRLERKIKFRFLGKLDLNIGSHRAFINTLNTQLNLTGLAQSKVIETFTEEEIDVLIFNKQTPYETIQKISTLYPQLALGIINPSDNKKKFMKILDFAIVGSVEEKAYYSQFIKCFVYPLIEEIPIDLIIPYERRPKKLICYHGNKMHLESCDIKLEKALNNLVAEGYEFKAIYNFKLLGMCKKSFITQHVQWDINTWLQEIASSSVGVCPSTHYSGFIRHQLAKLLTSKNGFNNDMLFRYKNTTNASRSFIFHQLKIPVVAELGGSHHHILGDEKAGFLCYSEKSWYESIKQVCENNTLSKSFSEMAFCRMNQLYNPLEWTTKLTIDLINWSTNVFADKNPK